MNAAVIDAHHETKIDFYYSGEKNVHQDLLKRYLAVV